MLGGLTRARPRLPLALRLLLGSMVCTAGELLFGLIFNREWAIWDYRALPLNLGGQICAAFSLAWIPVSGAAMWLYGKCDGWLLRNCRL